MKKTAPLSIAVTVILLAVAVVVEPQQPTKVPRIGFFSSISPSIFSDRVEAFRQGLRELGYVEGTNIVIEW
jgi:putative ABC transport system substrate-binding protein